MTLSWWKQLKLHSTETVVVVGPILEHMATVKRSCLYQFKKMASILLIITAFFIRYSTMVLEDAVLPGSEII